MKALHVGLRPVLVVFCALWLSTIHTQAAEEKTEAMLLLERLAEKLEPMVLTNTGLSLTNRVIERKETGGPMLPVNGSGLNIPSPQLDEPEPPMPFEWRELLSYSLPLPDGKMGRLSIQICKTKRGAQNEVTSRVYASPVGARPLEGLGDRAFHTGYGTSEKFGMVFFSRGVVYAELHAGHAKPSLSMAKSVDQLIQEFFKPEE